jgi:hypothetical protein
VAKAKDISLPDLVVSQEAVPTSKPDPGVLKLVLTAWREGSIKDGLVALAMLGATAPVLLFTALLLKTMPEAALEKDKSSSALKFRRPSTKPGSSEIDRQYSQDDLSISEDYTEGVSNNAADTLIDSLGVALEIPEQRMSAFRRTITDFAAAEGMATTRAAKPRTRWEDRKGADAKLSPPEFIAKHYAAEMAAGTLHRGTIAQDDKPLAVKLASWLRSHPMPENINIPTKPEWITRQAEAGKARPAPAPRTQGQRLYDALRHRQRRASM